MQPLIHHHDNLNNINDLKQFNELLKTDLKEAVSEVKWASRTFNLKYNDEEYHVKMKDIVSKFQELAKDTETEDDDVDFIGEVHDRIIELDFEGDEELNKKGTYSIWFRNLTHIFGPSHLEKTDKILEKKLEYKIDQLNFSYAGLMDEKEKLNLAREIIRTGFDSSIKNSFRLQAQENPQDAFKTLELFYWALYSLKENEKPKNIDSIMQFLNSMRFQLRAHNPKIRKAVMEVHSVSLPKIIDLYQSNHADQFRKKFIESDIKYKNALILLAEENPKLAYSIADTLKSSEDTKLADFCTNLLKQIKKIEPHVEDQI